MEINLVELEQSVHADLRMIAEASRDAGERIAVMFGVADAVGRHIEQLQELDTPVCARRQADGGVHLLSRDTCLRRMSEETARALRDQLDVALHVPPPDRPLDPPSRL